MIYYKFIQTSDNDFQRKLQERVNDYFARNEIVRKADKSMFWKTFFAFGFYALVYVVILFASISNHKKSKIGRKFRRQSHSPPHNVSKGQALRVLKKKCVVVTNQISFPPDD